MKIRLNLRPVQLEVVHLQMLIFSCVCRGVFQNKGRFSARGCTVLKILTDFKVKIHP